MLLLLMYTYMLKKHWKMVEALGSDLTICLSTELFFFQWIEFMDLLKESRLWVITISIRYFF